MQNGALKKCFREGQLLSEILLSDIRGAENTFTRCFHVVGKLCFFVKHPRAQEKQPPPAANPNITIKKKAA